jgi:hypothetical protein
MPPLDLYARGRFFCNFAHETAGAARTRLFLRPLPEDGNRRKARAHRAARSRGRVAISTVIVRESGRSRIPETAALKSIGHGVLDPRLRGDDNLEWSGSVHHANAGSRP